MHSLIRIARFPLLLVLFSADAAKAVEPALIFSDQMVLQREVAVPVWGRAEPGEQVTVSFAGQSKQATADAEGLWRAELDAMPASAQPRTMTLKGKGDAVTLEEVLVGDVWLLSGDIIGLGYYQGRFEKGSRMGVYYDIHPFIKQDQAAGRLPVIRTFVAAPGGRDRHALRPQYRRDTEGNAKWATYDPANWSGFHAIPYFFGREYFKRINVPVGVVEIGPVYDSHKVDGRVVTVRFKQVGRGLIIGDKQMGEPVKPAADRPLGGFELAGADGQWRGAAARIDGQRVIVTSGDLANPVTVRYAWEPRPKQANLYNQAGFAASPFNTHP